MLGEFVANYIQDSVSAGMCKPADIRARAEKDIKALDDEIAKIKELEQEQTKLRAVIKHLGGGGAKYTDENLSIDWSTKEEKLPDYFKEVLAFIINKIESNDSIDNKQLFSEFGIENQKTIYLAIKWLGARDFIERDGSVLVKGSKWDSRSTL